VSSPANSSAGSWREGRPGGAAEAKPAGEDRPVFGRIVAEVAPHRWAIFGLFLLSLLATPLSLLGPVPLKIAVDSALGAEPLPALIEPLVPEWLEASSLRLLVFCAVLQVLVALLAGLQTLTSSVSKTILGERISLGFRARLLRHVQRLSFAFHDVRGTADSIYRIQYDAPAIQQVAVQAVLPLISSGLTFFFLLYVMVRLDWQLALIGVAISPLLYLSTRSFRKRTRPGYRRAKRLESGALGIVHEVLSAFRVVKAFGREAHESERFVDHSSRGIRARVRLAVAENAFDLFVKVTTAAGTAAVLFVGVRNVQAGVLTLGELLMVLAYIAQLYTPLQSISRRIASLQRHLVSAQRAFALLDEVPDVVERPNARPLARAGGDLAFGGVCFGYQPGVPVLRDVSFVVPAGARLGICGRTGAGKTTLVSLLGRFYDPSDGTIFLDGVDLRDYKLDDLRAQFAFMLQEPVLFSTSIAENIAYARPGATREAITQAARTAGAHAFITELPEGYETVVGERGMRLSGGERQRVSLARAFLKDAPILVLDEPTSSVDLQTEAEITGALEQLMRGRTTLMIAHRPSTLRGCDWILEIRDGTVELREAALAAHRDSPMEEVAEGV
jgi:ATP-binding cassette subfamily B protein